MKIFVALKSTFKPRYAGTLALTTSFVNSDSTDKPVSSVPSGMIGSSKPKPEMKLFTVLYTDTWIQFFMRLIPYYGYFGCMEDKINSLVIAGRRSVGEGRMQNAIIIIVI